MVHNLSLTEISHVIALATAPAFLLGCVVALKAMLISRMARVVDRANALNSLDGDGPQPSRLTVLVPGLRRRAALLHYALGFAILSGVVLAFVGALLDLQLETPVATLFIVGLLFFVASLLALAYEVTLAIGHLRAFGLD